MHSQALAHADEAAARRFLKPGFAFSEQQDQWFALGYPHLTLLDDAHPGDADPAATARKLLEGYAWSPTMPAAATARMCRVWGVDGFAYQRRGAGRSFTRAGLEALDIARPVSAKDAEAWTETLFRNPPAFAHMARAQLLCTEALAGPRAVARGALAGLSGWTPEAWLAPDAGRFSQLLDLGMVLWRLPHRDHQKARAQLEGLRPDVPVQAVALHVPPSAHHGLALALEGASAARKLTANGLAALGIGHFSHAFGDPRWLLEVFSRFDNPAGAEPDARRVFLAGDALLELERSWWSRYRTPGAVTTIVDTYGLIRSPATVLLMLSISAKGKARRPVKRWFSEHWDFAAPHVEKATRRKELAAAARTLLADMARAG